MQLHVATLSRFFSAARAKSPARCLLANIFLVLLAVMAASKEANGSASFASRSGPASSGRRASPAKWPHVIVLTPNAFAVAGHERRTPCRGTRFARPHSIRRVAAVTEISLILFDLNGVLYRYDREARIAYLHAVSNQSPDAIRGAIWDSGFEDSGDSGALDATAYLEGFGARILYHLPEAEWVAAQRVAVTPIVATLALLPRLRSNVLCAVLTNNNLLVKKHFAALYPEVAALVDDRAYVSAEFSARKPDPDVYRRCLVRLRMPPASTLFVDDSAANVAGAREAGLQGFDYASADELEAELGGRGLLE
jgi:glucose-1-phosphatase